ncbi:hypothetical protein EMCG_09319 [[Emmonsia] crescens]|uniref:Uncharacterized protein n=1 Tax=[Emmonsia] crescens TaxID=73230 RepID=A0A0G2I317_9EURO|nr:hypothetical protein EMCG_09319 [Emmonsia crescens UAMH 3008]
MLQSLVRVFLYGHFNRIPENFYLPATIMPKAGAFLIVPQEADGSQLLISAQRRFTEKDKDGWDALAADKQGL